MDTALYLRRHGTRIVGRARGELVSVSFDWRRREADKARADLAERALQAAKRRFEASRNDPDNPALTARRRRELLDRARSHRQDGVVSS